VKFSSVFFGAQEGPFEASEFLADNYRSFPILTGFPVPISWSSDVLHYRCAALVVTGHKLTLLKKGGAGALT
jgi:hypothetical protein